jgi:hypothetical protein
MKLPRLIAEFSKNTRETVRVTLDSYKGQSVIGVRVWYADSTSGEPKPGRSGITLSMRHLPALAAGVTKALAKARKAGLLDDRPSGASVDSSAAKQ